LGVVESQRIYDLGFEIFVLLKRERERKREREGGREGGREGVGY